MRKRIVVFGMLLGASVPVLAQERPLGPPIADLLELSVSETTYPDADEVILYRGSLFAMDDEGRVTQRKRIVRRLLTDLAIDRFGDGRVAYDTLRQDLVIQQCRTFMRDGREVPARPNSLNRVSPDRIASCPDRLSLQEMVISHLGVERGCLVELDYTLTDRIAWRPWLEGIEEIAADAPILQEEFRFDLPVEIHTAFLGEPPGGLAVSETANWSFGPLPGVPNEGGIDRLGRLGGLVYSTCPDWGTLAAWLRRKLDDAAMIDTEIRSWCEAGLDVGRPPLNDEERLGKLGRLIGERTIRSDDTPYSWWLPVRMATRTFQTSCGNLIDRAALVSAVLQTWSIDAQPVLGPIVTDLCMDVPALSQFGDIWWEAARRSISSEDGTVSAGPDPGVARQMIRITDRGIEPVPMPTRIAKSALSLRLVVDSAGTVRGQGTVNLGGAFCSQFGFEDIERFVNRLAAEWVVDGEIAGVKVEALGPDTLATLFSLTGTALGTPAGEGRRRFRLPDGPGIGEKAVPDNRLLRRKIRSTPLVLPYLIDESVDIRIVLTEPARVVIPPRGETIRTGGASLESSVEVEGSHCHWTRSLRTTRRMIRPVDYPAFRELMMRRLEPTANAVYLNVRGGR